MKFQRIKLLNFRQFAGEQELKFSTNRDKNVTVIIGDNGAGKTTLLQAFNWCLFGPKYTNLDNKKLMLNKDVLDKMPVNGREKVYVQIDFEHLGNNYSVTRTEEYVKKSNENDYGSSKPIFFCDYIDSLDGETKVISEQELSSIFPYELSSYFLFDGERMVALSENKTSGKKDIARAVTNILGLDSLKYSITHLEEARKIIQKEFRDFGNIKLAKINLDIEKMNIDLKKENEKLDTFDEEMTTLDSRIAQLSQILRDNENSRELQVSKEKLEEDLKFFQDEEIGISKEMKQKFSKSGANFFSQYMLDEVISKLSTSDCYEKSIVGIEGQAIDELIERKKCICGNCIEEGNEAYNNLKELKQYLPPESIGGLVKKFQSRLYDISESNTVFINEIDTLYKKKLSRESRIFDLEKEIEAMSSRIENLEDLSKYEHERNQKLKRRDDVIKDITSIEIKTKNLIREIELKEKERKAFAITSEHNKQVQIKVDLCDETIKYFSTVYKERENEVRTQLQNAVSRLLSEMLHVKRNVKINNDYTFTVFDEYNLEVKSEGQSIVVSFAFMGGILEVAKAITKDAKNRDEELSIFPLVMDAPVAKLDDTHRRNTANKLNTLAEQIILFTVDSQWDGEFQKGLESNVDRYFKLKVNHSEGEHTYIESGVK